MVLPGGLSGIGRLGPGDWRQKGPAHIWTRRRAETQKGPYTEKSRNSAASPPPGHSQPGFGEQGQALRTASVSRVAVGPPLARRPQPPPGLTPGRGSGSGVSRVPGFLPPGWLSPVRSPPVSPESARVGCGRQTTRCAGPAAGRCTPIVALPPLMDTTSLRTSGAPACSSVSQAPCSSCSVSSLASCSSAAAAAVSSAASRKGLSPQPAQPRLVRRASASWQPPTHRPRWL